MGSNSKSFGQFLKFPRKFTNFWFAGLRTSFWKLCFTVAIDWDFTYFLGNTGRTSRKFSRVGPLMFLKVCNATPLMREWKYLILSSSVSWLWILRLFGKKSSNSSNFSDFPSNVGIIVVSDFGNLEIVLILLGKFADLLLFANCWSASKIWSASIVAGGVLFLLSWRCTRGAVCVMLAANLFCSSCHHIVVAETLFLNSYHHVVAFCSSCHHVVAVFWARVLCHLVVEEARFRMRVTLGVILIRSLVYTKCVPGHLRSGCGMALNEWFHEKVVFCNGKRTRERVAVQELSSKY